MSLCKHTFRLVYVLPADLRKIQYFNLVTLSWTENCANLKWFWLHPKQLLCSVSQPNTPLTKWLQAWIHCDCNERCSSEPEKSSAQQFRLERPFKVSHVKRYGWQASFDRPLVREKEPKGGKKMDRGRILNQQDSSEEANYKFDNTAGAQSDV